MNRLSLAVLGSFEARLGGELLSGFRTQKVQALLVHLAIEPGPQGRDGLMALLWPGLPESSARANLRQIIYLLRKAVPEVAPAQDEGKDAAKLASVPLLIANRQTLQLNPDADIFVDALEFEQRLTQVNSHDHLGIAGCLACCRDLEAAVQLYRGHLLQDFYLDDSNEFEDWTQARREFYRRKALDAMEILATIYVNQEDYPMARFYVERQLEVDNLRESAFRQLMEIMALSGQRSEALAVYENCRRILAEELAMAPTARTTRVYEQILAGDLTFGADVAQGIRGYELKEEIGQGAYGAIHRAVQPGVGREVAVKIIRRKYVNDPEFIRRFEAEAQTIARLEHPYIVPLYDYWRDPDGAYLVMRYLRGGSLLSALEDGPWQPEQAVKMLDQIASALSAAHSQGVVHRDIKPGNILLDPAGNAYLSDFGMAKSLDDERQLTAEGIIVGTFDYVSPEQIRNEPVGPQSDLYSLGAVLYETLTGERPFSDISAASLLYKHLNEAIPLVSSSRPDLPPQVDVVIQRATCKQPEDRYPDALEMARAFRHALKTTDILQVTALPDVLPTVELYNPYKGLRAFQETDADDFFGREALVQQLVARMDPALTSQRNGSRWVEARFMAVVGPSGSGKSSAVKAGLIRALRDGAIPAGQHMAASDKWFVAEMVPGSHPLEELELALWSIAVDPPPSLVEPMQRDTRGLLRTVRRVLPDEEGAQLLLVIDQFEELFTLIDDEERRAFFIDSLITALRAPRTPLWVIVTLRADFYDRPLQYESLGCLVKENTEVVLPLTVEELTWAIQEPARRVGVKLESELTAIIIADVADQPGALPLLQYALTELFERRRDNLMTRPVYEAIGGVLGALSRRAEALYGDLTPERQDCARQLFLRLVTLGEGVEDTRRRVLRSELEAISPSGDRSIAEVLDEFGQARLLIFDRDSASRQATVEIAHEALLREWQRLRRWLDESRGDVRMQRLLAAFTSEWLENDRDTGFLLREARLDQFAAWSEANTVALTPDEHAYLEASLGERAIRLHAETQRQAHEATLELRGRRFLHALVAVFAVAAIISTLLTIYAFGQRNDARLSESLAKNNAATATVAQGEALVQADLAAAREIEAQEQMAAAEVASADAEAEAIARATAQAEEAAQRQLAEEAQASAEAAEYTAQLQASIGLASQVELDLRVGYPHRGVLLALEALENFPYNPQAEQALARAVLESRARLILQHDDFINTVSWSPSGDRLLTASDDQTAVIWDGQSGERLQTLTGHQEWIVRATWSPDGQRVATAGADGMAIIWDADSGRRLQTLDHGAEVYSAAWSKDGSRVATSSLDGTARVWDATSGEELFRMVHDGEVFHVSWSPDAEMLATISHDGTSGIWDAATGRRLQTLCCHDGASWMTAWSPDGRHLATSEQGGRVQVWDAATGQEMVSLIIGAQESVIEWSPAGDRLAAGNWTGEAAVYDMTTITDPGAIGSVAGLSPEERGDRLPKVTLEASTVNGGGVAWSPDGSRIASSTGKEVKVYDPVTGEALLSMRGHKTNFSSWGSLSWSPDGRRLASVDQQGTGIVWDVTPNHQAFLGHEGIIRTAAWSPDETRIASAGLDGTIKIWDAASGELELDLDQGYLVSDVAWSPDGHRLAATVFIDCLTHIWDADTGEELYILPHGCISVSWSPNGKLLATANDPAPDSYDGTVKIWQSDTGQELHSFTVHAPDKIIWDVEWSPDGRQIVSTSAGQIEGGNAVVWDPETGELITDLGPYGQWESMATWSPDGKHVAIFPAGILVDAATGEIVVQYEGEGYGPGSAWSPNGSRLAKGGLNGVLIFDTWSGALVNTYHQGQPGQGSDWSSDGKRLLLCNNSEAQAVEIWPVWQSLEELIAYAKDCCVVGELSPADRDLFGLGE